MGQRPPGRVDRRIRTNRQPNRSLCLRVDPHSPEGPQDARSRDEGERFLRKATELNPDSWNFFRQMKNLGHKLGSGGPEYMARVRKWSKQGNEYYPLPDIEGIGGAKK